MSELQICGIAALLEQHPKPRETLIEGLLRRGEIMNIVAAPKSGKSMLVLDLAVSMALGRNWLGEFPVRRGNVLLVDCELHAETLADRVRIVLEAFGVAASDLARFNVLVARRAGGWAGLSLLDWERSADIQQFHPDLIIIDPAYRLRKAEDYEENSNEDVAKLYQQLDDLCIAQGCGLVVVHHTSKGSQAAKAATDMGSGAGAQSRAADTHLVLREHATPGCYTLEAVTRSFLGPTPTVFEYRHPRWIHRPDLDASDLRRDRDGARSGRRPKLKLEVDEVVALAGQTPMLTEELLGKVESTGATARLARRLVRIAIARGKLHEWRRGNNKPSRVATVPPPAPVEAATPASRKRMRKSSRGRPARDAPDAGHGQTDRNVPGSDGREASE